MVRAEQPVLKSPPPQLDDFIQSFAPMFKTGHRQFGLHVALWVRLICFEIRGGNGPNPLLQNATVQSPIFRETSSFRYFLYSSINTAVLEIWLWFDSKCLISSFSAAYFQAGRVSINKLLRREVPKMKRPPRSLDPKLKILFLILTVLVKWCYALNFSDASLQLIIGPITAIIVI